MKKLLTTVGTALLLAASTAWCAPLDDYYLEQFGEKPAAATAMKAAAPLQARRCGMPLRRGLKKDWNSLESGTQKVLAKYLYAPNLSGEAIARSGGGHFNIHYATIGADAPPLTDNLSDGSPGSNGIPDWVETVADTFEAVYAREVAGMGYRQPPTIPYDVYLQQLASLSEFGHTQSDVLTGLSATSFIVIDNDFADAIYGPYGGLTGLRITAAHEFHHAIQYGYNYYFDIWYAEATASWIEDEIYDSGNQLYDYFGLTYKIGTTTFKQGYVFNTTLPLDSAVDLATGGGYGRWPFNRYLYETHYPFPIVRSIWEDLATKSPVNGADIPMLPVIAEVLAGNGSSLQSSFLGFSKRFLLGNWTSHTSELSLFLPLDFDTSNTYTASGNFTTPAITLPAYSFRYLKLTPSGPAGQLTIGYPNKPAAYALVAFVQSGSNTSQYAGDSSGTIVIPLVSPADTVYLLICNNVTGTTTIPADQLQAIPSPGDATNPYPGSTTLVQPPAPVSSGGGGGGGCFIATAAYGSYLHPKVELLRDFRDRFLLTNTPGRMLVSTYYRYSPPMAGFIRHHVWARFLARLLLAPLVLALEHFGAVLCVAGVVTVTAMRRGAISRKERQAPPCIPTA